GGATPMSITTQYTLKEFDDATATLGVAGDIKPHPNAEPVVMNGMEMDAEFAGTQAGQTVLDRASGWVISSTIDQDMQGGMTMNLPDGQSIDIDMIIKGKITMKRAE
ncbi:MAG: DUF6263 family protein, partial [Planctomycetota bacterium]